MHKAVGWLIWFGMVSISAAEIVAWKVPLHRYSYQPEPRTRLENPPEASPFFRPGDELLDAGKPQGENAPEVEWAVWNETTGTLVTKSNLERVWPLRRLLDPDNLPRRCRLRLDVFETTADNPLDPAAMPAFTLEWLMKSGRKTSAVKEAEGKKIAAEADMTLDETGETAQLALEGTFLLPGQERLQIKTSFTVASGTSLWVAGDRSNGKGMEIRATVTTVLMDGTPLADSVRMQVGGKAVSISPPRHSLEKHRIGGKAWLLLAPIDLNELLPEESQEQEDPFSEPGTVVKQPNRMEKLKAATVPEPIAEWFKGPVLDIREIMTGMGIEITEGTNFAGYDLMGKAAVFFTASDLEADKVEQLLTPGCCLRPRNVSASCEREGKIHVMSWSAAAAWVERGTDEQNPVRRFDIEPVIGESGLLELGLRYQDRPSAGSFVLLDTVAILEDGRSVEVLGGGSETPLKIGGTIVEQ